MPGSRAGLAEQRRLLVAGDAGDRARTRRSSWRVAAVRSTTAPPSGSIARGTSSSASSSSSHSPVWMLNSSVRLALRRVGHVHAAAGQLPDQPGVDRAERELARARPAPARRGRGPAASASLVPEKYASSTSPVRAANSAARARPRAARRRAAAVRRSCQTMAWCDRARPVARSQTIVVSRWLVMPMAAMSRAGDAGLGQRLGATPDCVAQISVGVVLDPARLRKDLAEFLLRHGAHGARLVEHDGARTGRALVQCKGVRHAVSPCCGLRRHGRAA